MATIKINVTGEICTVAQKVTFTAGSYGVYVAEVTTDASWNDLALVLCIISAPPGYPRMPNSGRCIKRSIPVKDGAAALDETIQPCMVSDNAILIGLLGCDADGKITRYSTVSAAGKVCGSGCIDDTILSDESRWAELISYVNATIKSLIGTPTDEQVRNAIDSYASEHGISTGATAEQVAQIEQNTQAISSLTEEIEQSKQNGTGTGLTVEQINLLDSVFDHIYYIDDEGGAIADELIASLKASLPVTLLGISATYSGGNVTEGTNVNDLTGIVVTATYSDDSTEEVTGYTLSGIIVVGNNTITVTYKGLTTTFIVKGTEIEQDGLYPFENGTWSSANGNTVTISNGRHVVIDKTYAEGLWMSLTQCSKTSSLVTYANIYNVIGTNYTIPASADVLLKIYNIENNNGLKFKVGANKQSYFSYVETDLDMVQGAYTDEVNLNAIFEEETNLAGIFAGIGASGIGNLSFDVNLTVNGERWV